MYIKRLDVHYRMHQVIRASCYYSRDINMKGHKKMLMKKCICTMYSERRGLLHWEGVLGLYL